MSALMTTSGTLQTDEPEFIDALKQDRFFDAIDDIVDCPDERWKATQWQWLRLLRTEEIFEKLRKRIDNPHDYLPVLELLLERHVLHLENREHPEALIDFWEWVTADLFGCSREVPRIEWAEISEIPSKAMAAMEQEELFANTLFRFAKCLAPYDQLTWAEQTLHRIAFERGLVNRESVGNALVQIVFGIRDIPSSLKNVLRPGLLVRFRLRSQHNELFSTEDVANLFDRAFVEAANHARSQVGCHKWFPLELETALPGGALAPGLLKDGSGAIAMMVCQRLAQGGGYLKGKRWALPPWVVISAGYNKHGSAACGSATVPELVNEKATTLAEEGVRILLVPPGTEKRCRRSPWLALEEVAVPESPFDAASYLDFVEHVDGNGLIWPLEPRFAKGDSRLDPNPPGPEESAPLMELPEAQLFGFNWEHFQVPQHVFEDITTTVADLPGHRGYVLLTGPAGVGKTILMRAPDKYWPEALGIVFRYTVLDGRLEYFADFFGAIRRQAAVYEPADSLLPNFNNETDTDAAIVRKKLTDLLHHMSRYQCESRPLLIAIDGADRIDTVWRCPIAIFDILPHAEDLPDNCVFLLSSRSGKREKEVEKRLLPLSGMGRQLRKVSFANDARYHAMMYEYLTRKLPSKWHPRIDGFIDTATQSHHFLTIALLAEMADTHLGDISIGATRSTLIASFLENLKRRVDEKHSRGHFDQLHRLILCLLARTYGPITENILLHVLGDAPISVNAIRLALEELRVLVVSCEYSDSKKPHFCLAHEVLRSWLNSNEDSEWANAANLGDKLVLNASRRSIVTFESPYSRFALTPPLVSEVEGSPWELDGYFYIYLPSHLIAVGRKNEARNLLLKLSKVEDADFVYARDHGQVAEIIQFYSLRAHQIRKIIEPATENEVARADASFGKYIAKTRFRIAYSHRNHSVVAGRRSKVHAAVELFEILIDAYENVEDAIACEADFVEQYAWALRLRAEVEDSVRDYFAAMELFWRLGQHLPGNWTVMSMYSQTAQMAAIRFCDKAHDEAAAAHARLRSRAVEMMRAAQESVDQEGLVYAILEVAKIRYALAHTLSSSEAHKFRVLLRSTRLICRRLFVESRERSHGLRPITQFRILSAELKAIRRLAEVDFGCPNRVQYISSLYHGVDETVARLTEALGSKAAVLRSNRGCVDDAILIRYYLAMAHLDDERCHLALFHFEQVCDGCKWMFNHWTGESKRSSAGAIYLPKKLWCRALPVVVHLRDEMGNNLGAIDGLNELVWFVESIATTRDADLLSDTFVILADSLAKRVDKETTQDVVWHPRYLVCVIRSLSLLYEQFDLTFGMIEDGSHLWKEINDHAVHCGALGQLSGNNRESWQSMR